ncbi:cytochrome-c peroxidase [Acuticoccus kandeliae]|uniref:cytochrome-c peroxidase n=1 Tax=Acuticoccus kandeliae TaxID=2073160 RepID=UPI000D3EA562|nr:cytochrome c peroxidase [Acuticoccus kandeliae]
MRAILAAGATLGLILAANAGPAPRDALPEPVGDDAYRPVDEAEAALGQLLFYDPILSGNRNIACATCHHPRFATGDGVSLALGEGGIGLGPERTADPDNLPEQRVPRNAQALFNLGAREFTVMFHDGRIEADPNRPSGLRTPLGEDMVQGFASLLSAQTMFPVLSPDEMAGHYSESDVSKAVRLGRLTGEGGAWDIIARRVAALDDYRHRFEAVYPEIAAGRPIAFTDISNAIAAFVEFEWRSDTSPFDAFLRGEAPLPEEAEAGLDLFYGAAGCAACHTGPFQTDHRFHAMGAPQLGPGKGARFELHRRDEGRMEVTGKEEDAFRFRTPSLRNVARTGPWGHAGAHSELAAFLRDHVEPGAAAGRYDRHLAVLPVLPGVEDWAVMDDTDERARIMAAVEINDHALGEAEIAALLAFLDTLSDPAALAGRLGIPASVPSGLEVPR